MNRGTVMGMLLGALLGAMIAWWLASGREAVLNRAGAVVLVQEGSACDVASKTEKFTIDARQVRTATWVLASRCTGDETVSLENFRRTGFFGRCPASGGESPFQDAQPTLVRAGESVVIELPHKDNERIVGTWCYDVYIGTGASRRKVDPQVKIERHD